MGDGASKQHDMIFFLGRSFLVLSFSELQQIVIIFNMISAHVILKE